MLEYRLLVTRWEELLFEVLCPDYKNTKNVSTVSSLYQALTSDTTTQAQNWWTLDFGLSIIGRNVSQFFN